MRRWLQWAETTLDSGGRPGWLVAMVLGFILFWPLGLFILGYMIWSNRMTCGSWKRNRRHGRGDTGNSAFDDYRRETLRRLDEEREAFVTFLDRLRRDKDRAEFEHFHQERKQEPAA